MKLTDKEKQQVIINKELVDLCTDEAHKLILDKLSHRNGSDRFILYGRIVLTLFTIHFGASLDVGHRKQDEIEKKEGSDE